MGKEYRYHYYSSRVRAIAAVVMLLSLILILLTGLYFWNNPPLTQAITVAPMPVAEQDSGSDYVMADIIITFYCSAYDDTIVGYADIRWSDELGRWYVDEIVDVMGCATSNVDEVYADIIEYVSEYATTSPRNPLFLRSSNDD